MRRLLLALVMLAVGAASMAYAWANFRPSTTWHFLGGLLWVYWAHEVVQGRRVP